MRIGFGSTSLLLVLAAIGFCARSALADDMKIPVKFSGGHETDKRDGGRPVVLVAAGLGVAPDVFRKAFSGVTPARGGPPTGEQARRNKQALLKVLGPLGVTNDRLDEVSDYYRYRPEKGELWKNKPARAHAIVEEGKITRIVVTDGGSGYSSPPKATIEGFEATPLEAKIKFEKDLKKNGAVVSVDVATKKKRDKPQGTAEQ